MKNLAIIFGVLGVCAFIAATTYSRITSDASAVESDGAEVELITPATFNVSNLKEQATAMEWKRSVPDTAVDILPVIYGDETAPVIIEEFASFTCSHCAGFHRELLPKLKKQLLDTGLAQLHVYSFMRNPQDLDATLLVQCQSDNNKRKQFTSALMRGQEQWAFEDDFRAGLKTIANVGGMDAAAFDSCLADEAAQEKAIASRQWFDSQVGVDATPYFRVGSQVVKGAKDVNMFIEAIEAEIKKAATAK